VRAVDAAHHRLTTDDGEVFYDRLIIATGGRPNASAVPGLAGEFRAASWVVGEDSALEARNVLRTLREEPGPLVIGAAQGASYVSAAYELALALDTALLREGIRERVPMTFVTAEPHLGHLGFGQTAAERELEQLFAQRHIASRGDVRIKRVGPHEVELCTDEILPAQAMVIMPPFTGDVDIWKSANLTDSLGMIPVDDQYRHVEYPDIYAAGVAAYFHTPVPPLGRFPAPHTGYLSSRMGKAAGENEDAQEQIAHQPPCKGCARGRNAPMDAPTAPRGHQPDGRPGLVGADERSSGWLAPHRREAGEHHHLPLLPFRSRHAHSILAHRAVTQDALRRA
jgi:sulfide:quinone oxidoreductase